MARKVSTERLERLRKTKGVRVMPAGKPQPGQKTEPKPAPAPPPASTPVQERSLDLGPIVELIAAQGNFNRELTMQITRLVSELELSGSIEATVTERDGNGDIRKVRFDHRKPTKH